ncbi:hypothetical protein D3C81_398910 [compost metagenome]|uniref:Uncharacterized protein n=1 Tax=Paenibacillus stellifer TaxID=169760 RepID=A0A089LNZ8_9BACL|nr:hypothetical protein [Paenibacillus stellifer]AIQ63281.1 hypothetical protein PSTEL_09450 [Paenibacillus stellifer]
MDKKLQSKDGHYLFNVDILISANTDPLALQYLLELMNGSKAVTDFKINSELPLGKTIDGLLKARIAQSRLENATKEGKNTDAAKPAAPQPAAPAASGTGRPARPKQQVSLPEDAFGQIRTFIQENRLVRLIANRQGKQVSLPCRILNFDEAAGTLNVYHVDEKQVYMFNLNEIDEFM